MVSRLRTAAIVGLAFALLGAGGGFATAEEITVTLPGGVPLVLVRIPAGTFTMGSADGERGRWFDEVEHQVTLTQAYYLGETEVTQRQWAAVMGSNPSSDCGSYGIGDDYPVSCVSWNDICAGTTGASCTSASFIGKVNAALGSTAFRLPTEAEWELAARGGTQTEFSFAVPPGWDLYCGSFPEAEPYMWWCNNSGSTLRPVGQKQANPYGLYDMHGNVGEWVADWYGSYPSTPVTDPTGPLAGSYRVFRGGSWGILAQSCRSAFRYYSGPGDRASFIGFRLARSLTVGVPGDINGDGETNVGDAFYLINDLFAGGPPPTGWGDVNGDGAVNVSDVFYLINYLFAGGPAPV